MDLYIYNPDIELQGVIDGYSSLRWRRRLFEPGEFELHCKASPENLALLAEDNIIHRLDRDEAGIIEGITIATADSGGDEITATGRMGSSMLDQRIVTPTINFTGTVEAAMRKSVSDNAITARPLPHLILGTQNLFDKSKITDKGYYVAGGTGALTPNAPFCVSGYIPVVPNTQYYISNANLNCAQYDASKNLLPNSWCVSGGDPGYVLTTLSAACYVRFSLPIANLDKVQIELGSAETVWMPYHSAACTFQATYKTVLAVCEALGKAAPLGFRVRLDVPNKRWVFEVYDGIDRSAGQTVQPQVVFCSENQNIQKPSYARDSTGYANYAIVGGEGDGAARIIVEVDQTGGAPRRELWVDAKDLQKGTLSDTDYQAQLRHRGVEKLAEAARSESFNADAIDTGNYKYLTNWNLGDIVSFEKWGIRLDERITEVEEVDENGVVTITPTCGSPLPEALNLGDDS